MKKTVNITLEEIIKRKIQYHLNEDDEELIDMYKGYVRGFEEMLEDMSLPEEEFIKKYDSKRKEIITLMDVDMPTEKPSVYIEELSGYNNSIVDVLSLLDYQYLFTEDD